MHIFFVFLCLIGISWSNGVRSTSGQIKFDVNDDGVPEMILNSNGLGLGDSNPDAGFYQTGTLRRGFQNISTNTTLSDNSMVFVDTSSGDIELTLPYAGNVSGRIYSIKKTSPSNRILLSGGGNLIDDLSDLILDQHLGPYPTIEVMSNGIQWYVTYPGDVEFTIASDNLIAYWSFDSISGNTVHDQSDETHHGDLQYFNDPDMYDVGKKGTALRFIGNINQIMIPDTPDPGYFHDEFTEKTFCLWLTIDTGGGGPRVAFEEGGSTNGIALGYRTTPDTLVYVARASSSTTEIASTTTFAEDNNVWIHVAMVYSSGNMKLYINGTEESSGVRDASIPAHNDNLGIGYLGGGNSPFDGSENPWDGRIDEFYIYNKALSDSEIQAIYQRLR